MEGVERNEARKTGWGRGGSCEIRKGLVHSNEESLNFSSGTESLSIFPTVLFPAPNTVPDIGSTPEYEERTDEHFTDDRKPLKNINQNKHNQLYSWNHSLKHCWQKCKSVQPLWQMVWHLILKLNIHTPPNPGILQEILLLYITGGMCEKVHSSTIHS